jgi:hypothetical protein
MDEAPAALAAPVLESRQATQRGGHRAVVQETVRVYHEMGDTIRPTAERLGIRVQSLKDRLARARQWGLLPSAGEVHAERHVFPATREGVSGNGDAPCGPDQP